MIRWVAACLAWLIVVSSVWASEIERWKRVDLPEPANEASVTGIGEADFPDGIRGIWIGTTQGTYRSNGESWQPWPELDGQRVAVRDMQMAPDETGQTAWWLATDNGLLNTRDGQSWQRFDRTDTPLADDRILALHIDQTRGAEPELWVATAGGLTLWRGGSWTPVAARSDGFQGGAIVAIRRLRVDGEFQRWVASPDGLSRLTNGQWERIARDCLRGRKITAMETVDLQDRLHVVLGTERGLVRLAVDSPDECIEQAMPGQAASAIDALARDESGRLYVFFDSQVERWYRSSRSVDGWAAFNHRDGLASEMSWTGAGFRDRAGGLWAGSDRGAWRLTPQRPETSGAMTPALVINGYQQAPGLHVLPWSQGSVGLSLLAPAGPRSHAVRARLKLEEEVDPSAWQFLQLDRDVALSWSTLGLNVELMDEWGRVHGPFAYQIRRALPWLPITIATAVFILLLSLLTIFIRRRKAT